MNAAPLPAGDDLPLFVYGTLRGGHPALGAAVLLGPATTQPLYTLRDCGPWPTLCAGGHTRVVAELYRVQPSGWAALDAYEECPAVYVRATILLEAGTSLFAQAYFDATHSQAPALPSGDWLAARAPRTQVQPES